MQEEDNADAHQLKRKPTQQTCHTPKATAVKSAPPKKINTPSKMA